MKLLSLTDLSLIMILVFNSNGQKDQNWTITVPSNIKVENGSTATIYCNFSYPLKQQTDSLIVYWKKCGDKINIKDNDKNRFVYHPTGTFVDEKYRDMTKLIGDINTGNCSLQIQNVKSSDQGLYVRLIAKSDNYSFSKNTVSITVTEPGETQTGSVPSVIAVTSLPNVVSTEAPITDSTYVFVASFVPLSALVIILLIIGVYCFIKRKRSQSFTREESGYYANFSRPSSSNQVQRESSCKIIDKKAIDEPVYVNSQTPTGHSQDHSESIYANVDYSK